MTTGGKENAVLARLLRKYREQNRLTGPQLAERLDVTQGTVSKLENARLAPSIDYLSRFSHCLRLDRNQTKELMLLAGVVPADSQADEFLQFLPYDFLNLDWTHRRQRAMATCESAARVIRAYQPFLVPGLLQTPEYARRLFALAGVSNPRQRDRSVAARMERQRVLADREKRFVFLLSETALAWHIGTRAERERQVRRLMELGERPNLRIGLVPSSQPLPVLPPPAFYVFDSERVFLELPHGDLWLLEQSHAAATYLSVLEKLADAAIFGRKLTEYLEQIRLRGAA